MKSTNGYYFLRGASRDEDMFNNVMSYYRAHPGKYLVICGANHIADGKHVHTGEDTFGTRLKNAMPDKSEIIDLTR